MSQHFPAALPRATTQDLLGQYRQLSVAAREGGPLEAKIINGNLRFAYFLARRFEATGFAMGFNLDDLYSRAVEALLRAVREYDPRVSKDPADKNAFSGFAQRIVTTALVAFVKERPNSVGDPLDVAKSFSGDYNEFEPADDTDEEDASLGRVDADALNKVIESLPAREANVVRMRFGLNGIAPHDLAEIGAIINVSKQRVQAILDKALATLRFSLGAAASADVVPVRASRAAA